MEMKSRRGTTDALQALFNLVPPQARVIRNGKEIMISTSEVKVGDVVVSKDYGTRMVVVKILEKSYKYYDRVTGTSSNEITSTGMYEIKDIKVVDDVNNEVVVAARIGTIA